MIINQPNEIILINETNVCLCKTFLINSSSIANFANSRYKFSVSGGYFLKVSKQFSIKFKIQKIVIGNVMGMKKKIYHCIYCVLNLIACLNLFIYPLCQIFNIEENLIDKTRGY